MKHLVTVAWTLVLLAVAGAIARVGGFGVALQGSLQTHLLDWIMGVLCLLWLLLLLKVPWDLYFQAQAVAFEMQRAGENGIPLPPGRSEYIGTLRRRLGRMALAAHLLSAGLVAGIAWATHGKIGYYFAVFYLVSTVFRPAVAGYVYLSRKLRAIGQETHYPREDVLELRERLRVQEQETQSLAAGVRRQTEQLQEERGRQEAETRELRQRVTDLSREFESTISRLTDNQDIISGIQAFVRLIAKTTTA